MTEGTLMRLEEMTDAQLEAEAKERDRNGRAQAAAHLRHYAHMRSRLGVFDAFISNPTWHTRHPTDRQLFY
jgi:hypothetical protein